MYEGSHGWWEKAMAGRLKEYTGIDPFTIHQVDYSEKGDPNRNHPFQKAINPSESTVLLDKDQNPFQSIRSEAYTTLAVLHPKTSYVEGDRIGYLPRTIKR